MDILREEVECNDAMWGIINLHCLSQFVFPDDSGEESDYENYPSSRNLEKLVEEVKPASFSTFSFYLLIYLSIYLPSSIIFDPSIYLDDIC